MTPHIMQVPLLSPLCRRFFASARAHVGAGFVSCLMRP
uniref:Uncharacterized protein n=1 Tax=Arundo donax TaxID=35708 RepID=A0A0A9HN12_ARUDO